MLAMHVVRRHLFVHMLRGGNLAHGLRRFAVHLHSRERPSRETQYEQHDDEEFAPGRHGIKFNMLG
jgi:hypothetical protein